MNGDSVTSLEEFDMTGMDSVWLAIKIPRKTNDYRSVGMSPYEALYRKRCRSPLYQNEVGEHKMLGPEVVQRTKDIVDLIRGRLIAAQDRQKRFEALELEFCNQVIIALNLSKKEEEVRQTTNVVVRGTIIDHIYSLVLRIDEVNNSTLPLEEALDDSTGVDNYYQHISFV
ncbi:hypothetical protein AgCh_038323 [Apium graveolens]